MFAKMEGQNSRSVTSRNNYLLELAAVNAHTNQVHNNDIPSLYKVSGTRLFGQVKVRSNYARFKRLNLKVHFQRCPVLKL